MEDPKEEKQEQSTEVVSTQEKPEINPNQEEITIMPTMIDNSGEKAERARDFSSIIPQSASSLGADDGLALTSKEKELKGDGATILATLDENTEATLVPEAKLPEQIDVEERKAEQQKNKGRKRVDKKKKSMKKEHQIQNFGSLIAIVAIIIIGVAGYIYFFGPKDSDFKVKNLTIEIGSSLPIRASSYVTPGVGKDAPDYEYQIKTDDVQRDKVGKYTYSVTHNGITKKGTIEIVDTTPPVVKVRNYVVIRKGASVEPSKFIAECLENEGCTYSFQEPAKVASYTSAGTYTIYVVATDLYGNSVTKQVTLVIESEDKGRRYVKHVDYDFNSGYEMTETYDLHFDNEGDHYWLVSSIHTISKKYSDKEKYDAAVKDNAEEINYSFQDYNLTMVYSEAVWTVGNNYSTPEDIDKYLTSNGFVEEYED